MTCVEAAPKFVEVTPDFLEGTVTERSESAAADHRVSNIRRDFESICEFFVPP